MPWLNLIVRPWFTSRTIAAPFPGSILTGMWKELHTLSLLCRKGTWGWLLWGNCIDAANCSSPRAKGRLIARSSLCTEKKKSLFFFLLPGASLFFACCVVLATHSLIKEEHTATLRLLSTSKKKTRLHVCVERHLSVHCCFRKGGQKMGKYSFIFPLLWLAARGR